MDTINILAPTDHEGELPFKLDPHSVEGSYKAIQEWVISFLTQRGSLKILPEYGTDFLTYLSSGVIINSSDVHAYFDKAAQDAINDLVKPGSPDELTVKRATLINYSIIERDIKRVLVMYVGFGLSDGTMTRANLGVN